MTSLQGRRTRHKAAQGDLEQTADDTPQAQSDALSEAPERLQDDLPPHVWRLLQDAGAKAAERLLSLLERESFTKLAPSAQARLIELALTRAYGLPVRRSVSLELSSTDADAVAASLHALQDALPERQGSPQARSRPVVDVTPSDKAKAH